MRSPLPALALLAAACAAPSGAEDPVAVEVTLSPAAARALAARSEAVVIDASFFGDPTAQGRMHADEIGQIDLGRETITRGAGDVGRVLVPTTAATGPAVGWTDGVVRLNVNVYSARRSGPDNILACDFFDGTLESARRAPVALRCGLIAESPETAVRS